MIILTITILEKLRYEGSKTISGYEVHTKVGTDDLSGVFPEGSSMPSLFDALPSVVLYAIKRLQEDGGAECVKSGFQPVKDFCMDAMLQEIVEEAMANIPFPEEIP